MGTNILEKSEEISMNAIDASENGVSGKKCPRRDENTFQ